MKQWNPPSDDNDSSDTSDSDSDTATPAPKKRKKDPNLPKRPSSSFMIFATENRTAMREKYPKLHNREISKLLATMWRKLSDEEKQKYKDIATKDFAAYSQKKKELEMSASTTSSTPDTANDASVTKETPSGDSPAPPKPKRGRPPKAKVPKEPKKPRTKTPKVPKEKTTKPKKEPKVKKAPQVSSSQFIPSNIPTPDVHHVVSNWRMMQSHGQSLSPNLLFNRMPLPIQPPFPPPSFLPMGNPLLFSQHPLPPMPTHPLGMNVNHLAQLQSNGTLGQQKISPTNGNPSPPSVPAEQAQEFSPKEHTNTSEGLGLNQPLE